MAEVETRYSKGKVLTESTFSSTSSDFSVARRFAEESGSGKKLGVLLIISGPKGKDIAMFSEVKSEGEVLLLPGASFRVDNVEKPAPGGVEKMVRVYLTQTA
jgi:hypothetical protein